MSPVDSTRPAKPNKPYPGFPLFPHATGRWAKKIRGKLHYFGPWADPDAALKLYLDRRDALHAGLTPADTQDEMTVRNVCGKFLMAKKSQFERAALSAPLYEDYRQIAKRLTKLLGSKAVKALGPDDFARVMKKMPKTWGVYQRKHEVVRIKTIFKFAADEGLIDRPPVYGTRFKPPSAKEIRSHRASRGSRLFTVDDIRRLIDAANLPLRAMILLGLNAALGNSDLAELPMAAIADGWMHFARVKTGVDRRCPLWPETLGAIDAWLAERPTPAEGNESLMFVTAQGGRWAHPRGSALTAEFTKLLRKVGVTGSKSFYSLRRTFQNVGENLTRDFLATRAIMGHITDDVSEFYRENASDERLRNVATAVRWWVFPLALGRER